METTAKPAGDPPDQETKAGFASTVGAPAVSADVVAIQQTIINFAYRDQGDWERLLALFTGDATINVSWYRGPIKGFVNSSAAMAATAPPGKHWMSPPRVEVVADRAVADTDVAVMVRIPSPRGDLDLTSWARFHDLLERVDGRWLVAKRTGIYERDRLDPVSSNIPIELPESFSTYPGAYRCLAFVLSQAGRPPPSDACVAGTPAEAEVLAEGEAWLANAHRA